VAFTSQTFLQDRQSTCNASRAESWTSWWIFEWDRRPSASGMRSNLTSSRVGPCMSRKDSAMHSARSPRALPSVTCAASHTHQRGSMASIRSIQIYAFPGLTPTLPCSPRRTKPLRAWLKPWLTGCCPTTKCVASLLRDWRHRLQVDARDLLVGHGHARPDLDGASPPGKGHLRERVLLLAELV